jgi:sarcosine oxidase gamma subunit
VSGWLIPAAYPTRAEGEVRLGLADISSFAKTSLQGRGVPAVAEALLGEGAASGPRRVVPFVAQEPALACRLTADHLLLLASRPGATFFNERLANLPTAAAVVRCDVTTAQAGFLLAGESGKLLRRLTSLNVSSVNLPPGSCAETELAGVHALLVRPPGEAPPSSRIYVAWDLAEYVWETLVEAGNEEGIRPMGLDELPRLGILG